MRGEAAASPFGILAILHGFDNPFLGHVHTRSTPCMQAEGDHDPFSGNASAGSPRECRMNEKGSDPSLRNCRVTARMQDE